MKKTLILPAEIHSREFDARLLQGVLALERGWRVIVGSKALINRSIWRLPSSLYLCQTLTHKRLPMLKLLKSLGHVSYGWDEEGLVSLDRGIYLMRRVSTDSLGRLAGLVAWGNNNASDLDQRAQGVGLKARPLGNPRFDLLRPELRGLYGQEVEAIRKAHGEFVLINTNFPSINPVISLHDLGPRALSAVNTPKSGEPARFSEFLEHRSRIYEYFKRDLPQYARENPDLKFIVRPHPAENAATWTGLFQGLPNVQVIREGASIPWLIAAKALIHNGCTTAVEASLLGHTAIAYGPEVSLERESALPNPISHRVANIGELGVTTRTALRNELQMGAEQRAILEHYVSGITGPLASDAILDFCEELIAKQPARSPLGALPSRVIGAFRHGYKYLRRDHITDRYLAKVFPTLGEDAVSRRAGEIAAVLKLPYGVQAKQISRNVFELSAGARR